MSIKSIECFTNVTIIYYYTVGLRVHHVLERGRIEESWKGLSVIFLEVCSPEKDCWLSFLAYSSKENYSAWRGWVAGVARRFKQVDYPSSGDFYLFIIIIINYLFSSSCSEWGECYQMGPVWSDARFLFRWYDAQGM